MLLVTALLWYTPAWYRWFTWRCGGLFCWGVHPPPESFSSTFTLRLIAWYRYFTSRSWSQLCCGATCFNPEVSFQFEIDPMQVPLLMLLIAVLLSKRPRLQKEQQLPRNNLPLTGAESESAYCYFSFWVRDRKKAKNTARAAAYEELSGLG